MLLLRHTLAKKVGLPGYSSLSYGLSIETEISDIKDVESESSRIFDLLIESIDRELQSPGFVPDPEYGLSNNSSSRADNNGNHNGQHRLTGGNGHNGNGSNGHSDHWSCSDKQKEFIQKLVAENDLDRNTVEQTALDRFGVGVRQLNKLQASGLISELLESCGKNGKPRSGKGGRR